MSGRQRGQNKSASPGGGPLSPRRHCVWVAHYQGVISPSFGSSQLRAVMVMPVSTSVGVPTPLVAASTIPPTPVTAPGPARSSAGAAPYIVSPELLAAIDMEPLEFAEVPPPPHMSGAGEHSILLVRYGLGRSCRDFWASREG